jgi:signal transduction histidine kinase
VQHLLSLIRDDSAKQLATNPAFAEIKSIQDDFESLMNDRRKLESQRLETAQLRTVTCTAQMLAHDIRRPFSLLKATLDGLTQTTTPEAMRELVSETVPGVKKSLEHLDGIISELTAIGSNSETVNSTFSLSDAIARGIAIAAPHEAAASRIEKDICSAATISGNQVQIERVIANIVTNAIQATGPCDRISVATSDDSPIKATRIAITNTGSHIDTKDLEAIFQPFFTKDKQDGTGLGLAICRKIVADHGGTITASSQLSPKSTTFEISLPKA